MQVYFLPLVIVVITVGCTNQSAAPKSTPSKEGTAAPNYHLVYKTWSGISPGAGFTHTRLHVVELDLKNNKSREFRKSATYPDPMLPHDDAGIAKLVSQAAWHELSPQQASAFREAIRAWLKTAPPQEYDVFMNLGIEDGRMTSLIVAWDTNVVTTTLNPRGGYRKDDPRIPPEEWKTLLNLLELTDQVRDGNVQPVRKR